MAFFGALNTPDVKRRQKSEYANTKERTGLGADWVGRRKAVIPRPGLGISLNGWVKCHRGVISNPGRFDLSVISLAEVAYRISTHLEGRRG